MWRDGLARILARRAEVRARHEREDASFYRRMGSRFTARMKAMQSADRTKFLSRSGTFHGTFAVDAPVS